MISTVFEKRIYSDSARHDFTLCMLGNFTWVFLFFWFFQNNIYEKFFHTNTIRVSSSLDPDQARHFVGPDLGPNCLQTDEKMSPLAGRELNSKEYKSKWG